MSRFAAPVAFVGAIAFGVVGLVDALPVWVGAVAVGLAALAAWPETWPRVDIVAVRLVGATIVAVLTLVGVNVAANLLGLRPPILVGLAIATAVFALAAAWYLSGAGWGRIWTAVAALALALVAVIGAPILVGTGADGSDDVATAERVRSKLDVLIVTDGTRHRAPPDLPPDPSLRGFDVRYAVGFADGTTVRWTLTAGDDAQAALRVASRGTRRPPTDARPPLRQDADRVLVMLVDGTAPVTDAPVKLPNVTGRVGEVSRWRALARDARAKRMPAFALLQTTRRSRLERWKRFAPGVQAVSVQAFGSQTATDAAVRLAAEAPTARADFALAMRFRPILLFDGEEPVPRPLSIATLFEDGRVALCRDRRVARSACDTVRDARDLQNGGTHLRLDRPKSEDLRRIAKRELAMSADTSDASVAKLGAGSAIYVHPVSVERDGRQLLYLDYWWYLPANPAGVGHGAFCGPGLVIPGITCHDHESDWEGVTVIVDRTRREPFATAVQYAQHSGVVSYRWRELRKRWDNDRHIRRLLSTVTDASVRPVAFVASGTHASYPTPCSGGCHQVAKPDVGEAPHHGDLAWSGNDTSACGVSSCLQMLPTREGGRRPALWNDFAGLWGERHCALTYYCDSGSPPAAPGRQHRYTHPTDFTATADVRGRLKP